MKISIITASYNSAENIAFALKSVAMQQYHDIEHIIIDGNSSDDTVAIVADFPHVSKLVSEPDLGIYDAMNKGISLATGDVVGILNSDDYYVADDIIGKVAQIFKDNPAIDCLYADLDSVSKIRPERSENGSRVIIMNAHFTWAGCLRTPRFLYAVHCMSVMETLI